MSIIMVDYEDAYVRSAKMGEMSLKCAALAASAADDAEVSAQLMDLSQRFASLEKDIKNGADVWEEFYRNNIRL